MGPIGRKLVFQGDFNVGAAFDQYLMAYSHYSGAFDSTELHELLGKMSGLSIAMDPMHMKRIFKGYSEMDPLKNRLLISTIPALRNNLQEALALYGNGSEG